MKKNLIIALLICTAVICTSLVACNTSVHTHVTEKVDAKAATCSVDGNIEYYYCEGCGKYFKDTAYTEITKEQTVIAALGHDIEHHDAQAPSCTQDGWNAYDTCQREGCDYTTYNAIAALGHDFNGEETVITPATCTAKGSKTVKCTRCDETTTKDIEIDKDAHDIEHHDAKAATCTEDGWNAYDTCKREGCDYTTKVVVPAAHTEVIDEAKAPTCTETGLTEGKHCSACNEVIVAQQTVDALKHDYKETVVEPTTEADGYVLHKCGRCQDEYKDGYFNYYRFEAENAISNAWNDGTNWLWRWYDKDMASGNCYVGHISDSAISVPGQSYMLFAINAEKDATVSLYASIGFGEMPLSSAAFTVTVNGVDLAKLGNENGQITAVDSSYDADWENFTLAKLSDGIVLKEGVNVIVITVNSGATCNMDYIQFTSSSKLTAHAVEHSCNHRCGVCGKCKDADCKEISCTVKCQCEKGQTYRFEAENAASNAWGADEGGTNQLWKTHDSTNSTSNGWYVGHISNSAIDVPGESWMSFTFTASADANASLSMCLALPDGFIVNTAFTIEINGVVVAKVGNTDGKIVPNDSSYEKGWDNYTLCWVTDNVTLKEGENVLKLTVMSGATCNMDYIELTTTATITGNK